MTHFPSSPEYLKAEQNIENILKLRNVDISKKEKIENGIYTYDNYIVFWSSEPKLGVNLRLFNSVFMKHKKRHVIIVIKTGITPNAKPILKGLRMKKIFVDVFTLTELQIDIMEHRLVPKHEICSSEEKEELIKTYAVTSKQLPHIKFSDPIIRRLGARHGQMIKITRKSKTMPGTDYPYFRIVV